MNSNVKYYSFLMHNLFIQQTLSNYVLNHSKAFVRNFSPQFVTFATTNTSMWLFAIHLYAKGIRAIDNSLISMQFVSGNSVRYMHVGH